MDKPVSELTYKVVAHSVVPDFIWDDCVDWAYEMLKLGYDTPNLLMLAGITKPTDYYATINYFQSALSELSLEEQKGENAVLFYSTYLIREIANGGEVKLNLGRICQVYTGQESPLPDFYLLYWAWGDLDHGEKYQDYWPSATKENIEQIVIETAQKWLIEHENQLLL